MCMCLKVLLLAIVFSGSCQSQDNAALAVTAKVGPKADVLITIINHSDTTAYFVCGIEQRIRGEWREIVLDVSRKAPAKSATVNRLEPQKQVNFTWFRQSYTEFLATSESIVRVKVTPTDRSGAPKGSLVFSEEIKLKKPNRRS